MRESLRERSVRLGGEPGSRDIPSDRRLVSTGYGKRLWLKKPDGLRTATFLDFWWGKGGTGGVGKLRWHKGSKWPS